MKIGIFFYNVTKAQSHKFFRDLFNKLKTLAHNDLKNTIESLWLGVFVAKKKTDMKYSRLTKEQFEELHQEFINFLSTQAIDKAEWDKIKIEKPAVAEQELDVFSDLVWEGVLGRAQYLEHFSKNHIFLFQCFDTYVQSIVLKSLVPETDFLTKEGLQWLSDNMFTETIEIKTGKKAFTEERNSSIFELIQQGSFLSDGQLFKQIISIIES